MNISEVREKTNQICDNIEKVIVGKRQEIREG